MKLIVLLFFIVGICSGIYFFFYFLSKYHKKINWKIFSFAAFIGLIFVSLLGIVVYKSATAPSTYCSTFHTTNSYPPTELKTGMDYFEQGNYDYDTGNCKKAIEDYNQSIKLSPKYPQAYNNRAYTYMRLEDYKDALPDLDKAIALNPNYINALMNRADIHSSYYDINYPKAIADYEKIISLGGSPNVCTRLLSAQHNGADFKIIFIDPVGLFKCIR